MYRKEFKYKVFFIKMESEKQKPEIPKYCSHCGRELHVREKRTYILNPDYYNTFTGELVKQSKQVLEELLACPKYREVSSFWEYVLGLDPKGIKHTKTTVKYIDGKLDQSALYDSI